MDWNPQPKAVSDCSREVKRLGTLVIVVTLFSGFGGFMTVGVPAMGELGHFMHDFGVFVLFLTPWGLTTGIGLLRAWRWARISMLVFSGLLAAFGALMFMSYLLMPIGDAAWREALVLKLVGLLFGLIPAAIGVRWLIYFRRSNVKDHFQTPRKAPTAFA